MPWVGKSMDRKASQRRRDAAKVTWRELVDQDGDVVRVAHDAAGTVRYRVVVHGDKSWRVERRIVEMLGGSMWGRILNPPRNGISPTRLWRSPEAAMRAVEALLSNSEESR